MNKSYKVVYNRARSGSMVVSEVSKASHKKTVKSVVAAVATALAFASGAASAEVFDLTESLNAPVNQTVVKGAAQDIININLSKQTEPYFVIALKAVGGMAKNDGGLVTINGSELNINIDCVDDLWAVGINANNASTPSTSAGKDFRKATVIVNSDQTTIAIKNTGSNEHDAGIALNAMSEGTIEINGNLKATADTVITTRGNSFVKVNASGTKHVELDGDVSFNYDKGTSGTTVDSNVLVNLTDSTSYWTGKSFVNWDYKPVDALLEVKDFTLGVANGAQWNVTGNSFVNHLTLNGGIINTNKNFVEVFNSLNVDGDTSVTNLAANSKASTKVVQTNAYEITGLAADTLHAQGALNINKGVLTVTGTFTPVDVTTTINSGATLVADTMDLGNAQTGSVKLVGGTLQSGFGNLFETTDTLVAADAKSVTAKSPVTVKEYIAGEGTLAVDDKGFYTVESLKLMSDAVKKGNFALSFVNATLAKTDPKQDSVLVEGIVQEQEKAKAEVAVTPEGEATLNVGASTGAAAIVVAGSTPEVAAVKTLTISGSGTQVVLAGSETGGAMIQDAAGQAVQTVKIADGTNLALGSASATTEKIGHLQDLTLEGAAGMSVQNMNAGIKSLVTGATSLVTVGSNTARATLTVDKLNLTEGSTIFIDPAWASNVADQTINNASHMVAASATLSGNLVAGQNSLAVIGATADKAIADFNRMAVANNVRWGQGNIEAALYLGAPISLTTGSIIVDGSLTSSVAGTAGQMDVKGNSLLMVDAAAMGTAPAVTGTVAFAPNARLGLVNASVGTFDLATTVTGATNAQVMTDNPFFTASITGNQITGAASNEQGVGALGSIGIQSMAYRADSLMSESIAERLTQKDAGHGLWVDVSGENYKRKGMDNGARFTSDMGYAVFGGDWAMNDALRLGVALQMGKGSLRSPVSNIHNDIRSYGLSAYAQQRFGDISVIADVNWLQSQNEVKASQTALNQDVDANIVALGVRGQYEWQNDLVRVIPSVGVRVSRLETDAMNVGAVSVDKQKQTLVQMPLSVSVEGFSQDVAGWTVTPQAKLTYAPTFGDKEIKVFGIEQDVIDASPVSARLGVAAQRDNMSFSFDITGGHGGDETSALGGKIGFKYVY